jgi:hypothetical protein
MRTVSPLATATNTRGAQHGSEFRLEYLQRDPAIVLQVLGEVHGRHTALTELALDAVAVRKRGCQAGWYLGHA